MDLTTSLVGFLLAAVLGGLMGIQREATHKPAGLRTHLIVAVSTCALGELARLLGDDRIGQGVVTGIGFLGAGAIVRVGSQPHNLTTAATIWAAAAVGLIVGLGGPPAVPLAVAATVLTLAALLISDRAIGRALPRTAPVKLHLTYDCAATDAAAVRAAAQRELGDHVMLGAFTMTSGSERSSVRIALAVRPQHPDDLIGRLERLARAPGILGLETAKSEALPRT